MIPRLFVTSVINHIINPAMNTFMPQFAEEEETCDPPDTSIKPTETCEPPEIETDES